MKFFRNKVFLEYLVLIIIALAVFLGTRFSIQTYIVYGPSMQPTFIEHEWLIVNKLAYKFGEPHRGDVIVFKPPFAEKVNYIKRIIALPGESVEVKNGVTYVYTLDGQVLTLDEPYISTPPITDYTKHTVPEGQYWVMGDNRINSNDSRTGWTVPKANIIGKALINIWPVSRWGVSKNHVFTAASLEPAGIAMISSQGAAIP
jgi:signal peptidase I